MNFLKFKKILIRTISLSFVLLSLSTIGTFGQGTVLEKKAFDEILKNGWDKLDGRKYSAKNVVERFTDKSKPADDHYVFVYETMPPDRKRNVYTRTNGNTVSTGETITIGPRNYYRTNGGEWSENSNSGAAYASSGVVKRTYESYKIIEKTKLDNIKVSVYEAVTKDTNYPSGDRPREEITTKRYWINSKGEILKVVVETEIVGTKEFSRSTTTYNFDGKFHIEAPIK